MHDESQGNAYAPDEWRSNASQENNKQKPKKEKKDNFNLVSEHGAQI